MSRNDQDLIDFINKESMLQVSLDASSLMNVFSLLNSHIKTQSTKIKTLEAQLSQRPTLEAFNEQVNKVSEMENKYDLLINRVTEIDKNHKEVEGKLMAKLESLVNDAMITTTIGTNSRLQDLESQINFTNEELKLIKKRETGTKTNNEKLTITPLPIAVATPDIKHPIKPTETIKQRVFTQGGQISKESLRQRTESAEKPSSETQSLKPTESLTEKPMITEHALDRSSKSEMKLDLPTRDGFSEEEDSIYIVSTQRDHELSHLSKSMPTDLMVGEKIQQLKEIIETHEERVKKAMHAINDELQLIRDNGEGLQNLPPLNLAKVVPSFFNNPSYRFNEPESSGLQSPSDTFPSTPAEKENKESIRFHRLIRHSSTGLSEEGNNYVNESVYQTSMNDLQDKINKLEEQITDTNLFKEDIEKIKSELDRKSDRIIIEKVFDKFRVIFRDLNEKVANISQDYDQYATKEEVKIILQAVKQFSQPDNTGPVIKRGPECLLCGRPRTSVSGAISQKTAALAGRPCHSVAGNRTFVYGDGSAFKSDEFGDELTAINLPHISSRAHRY